MTDITCSLRLPSAIPNYEHHYCGGDAIRWMGVKRCGGAMHHGHYIACNIHQTVLAQTIPGFQPDLRQLTPVEPMIGLAVGKQAVASGPDGTIFGEEVAQSYFRDDLGFDSTPSPPHARI